MQKIKLHPAFCILIVVLLGFGRFSALINLGISVAIHEFAHFLVAKRYGYTFDVLEIMPYGAVMYTDERINPQAERIIALAGPLSNLALSVVLVALWWLKPSVYNYTLNLMKVNLATGIVNIFPVYPLDGGRIIYSYLKDKKNSLKIMKITGLSLSIAAFGLFVWSAFYKINYPIGIFSVMLSVNVFTDTQNRHYYHICSKAALFKSQRFPIEKRELEINLKLPLIRVVSVLKPNVKYRITIVDDDLRAIKTITETELEKILLTYRLNTEIGKAIQDI